MMATHARPGRVAWIGVRPARLEAMRPLERVYVGADGLAGDHARPGRRAVTLIQAEHLPVIASLVGQEAVDPSLLRRNILISGINLTALRKARLAVGGAVLEITGPAAPCSRMEAALGPGGFNAMRGHGGWCASVVAEGEVRVGDAVVSATG
jgi:MOSC domain-containing protein YiiM